MIEKTNKKNSESEPIITNIKIAHQGLDSDKKERESVLLKELIEEMDNLTFYDGVILVWEIFERIINDYFDENDKDKFGFRYDLGLIDKMQDILNNEVLNKIENLRKERLHELFILKSDLYKLPLWIREQKDKITTP